MAAVSPEMAGAAFSAFGQLVGNYLNRAENQSTRQYNRDLARLQNQYAVQQWNRENIYNHPLNQRRRLEAAGFNPNLAFSNGLDNTAAMSPQMTAGAPATPAPVGFGLGSTAELALLNAQKDNIQADTEQKKSATEGQNLENTYLSQTLDDRVAMVGVNKGILEQQMQNAAAMLDQIKATTKGQNLLNDQQALINAIREMNFEDYQKSMVESWHANNRALNAEGRAKEAQAEQMELTNRIYRNAQNDPELFAKLVQGYAATGEINTQEAIRLTGENIKEGNDLVVNTPKVGQKGFGVVGLMINLFKGLIPRF